MNYKFLFILFSSIVITIIIIIIVIASEFHMLLKLIDNYVYRYQI